MKLTFTKNSLKIEYSDGIDDYEIDLGKLSNEILYKLIDDCSKATIIDIEKEEEISPFSNKIYEILSREFVDNKKNDKM